MTQVKTNDNRKNYAPTFADIKEGVMFTESNSELIFIKTEALKNEKNTITNAIDIEGDTHWFNDYEEIEPIQEIEITIKK